MDAKVGIRKLILNRRSQMDLGVIRQKSLRIYDNLICDKDFICAKCVFVYCSTEREIDTFRIIDFLLLNNVHVCVPRCEKDRDMTAREIISIGDLKEKRYSILQPPNSSHIIDSMNIDYAVVPALCADKYGVRLGYGGGYYDRFLKRTVCKKCVLCFEENLFDFLPSNHLDVLVDSIITENGVYLIDKE